MFNKSGQQNLLGILMLFNLWGTFRRWACAEWNFSPAAALATPRPSRPAARPWVRPPPPRCWGGRRRGTTPDSTCRYGRERLVYTHSHARTFGSTPFFILLIPCDMKTKEVITRVVSPSSVCEAWRRRSCAAAHRRHPGFHLWRRRRRQPGAQGQGRLGEQEDLPGGARGEKRRTRRDFVSRFFAVKALIEILHGEENAEIRRLACLHDMKKSSLQRQCYKKECVADPPPPPPSQAAPSSASPRPPWPPSPSPRTYTPSLRGWGSARWRSSPGEKKDKKHKI